MGEWNRPRPRVLRRLPSRHGHISIVKQKCGVVVEEWWRRSLRKSSKVHVYVLPTMMHPVPLPATLLLALAGLASDILTRVVFTPHIVVREHLIRLRDGLELDLCLRASRGGA